MGIPALIPKGLADKKPPHGEPCTRCGICCIGSLCPLGQKVFRRAIGPCPALSFDAAGSVCGLVANPMAFEPRTAMKSGVDKAREAAAHLIGSATGCDCRVNGETPNRAFYDKLRIFDRANREKTRAALKLWGL